MTNEILTRQEFFTLCAKIILLGSNQAILVAASTHVLSKDFAREFIGIYNTVPSWIRKGIIHTTQTSFKFASFKFDDGSYIKFVCNPEYARGLSLSFAGVYVGDSKNKKFEEWCTQLIFPALPRCNETQIRLRRFK